MTTERNTLKQLIQFDMIKAIEISLEHIERLSERYKNESLHKSFDLEQVSQDAELLKWCSKALFTDTSILSFLKIKPVVHSLLLCCSNCKCES